MQIFSDEEKDRMRIPVPPMATTALQIAEGHCANWHFLDLPLKKGDGFCLGIGFHKDGRPGRFREGGCKCLLFEKKRCLYLEQFVFPLRKSPEWRTKYQGQAKAFDEAVDRYMRLHMPIPGLAKRSRKCPDCGTWIGPRKRYCVKCTEVRRKATYRDSKSRSPSTV